MRITNLNINNTNTQQRSGCGNPHTLVHCSNPVIAWLISPSLVILDLSLMASLSQSSFTYLIVNSRRAIKPMLARVLGFEPRMVVLETTVLPLHYTDIMVGKAGLEPAMYLTSRFYRPLASPICILAHIVATNKKRNLLVGCFCVKTFFSTIANQ